MYPPNHPWTLGSYPHHHPAYNNTHDSSNPMYHDFTPSSETPSPYQHPPPYTYCCFPPPFPHEYHHSFPNYYSYYHPPPFHIYPPFPASVYPPPHYYNSTEQQPRYDHCCCCGSGHRQDDYIQPQLEEKKTINHSSTSLPPFCPYPIYMKTETPTAPKDKDYNSPAASGDAKGFPFPILWLPSNNNQMTKEEEEEEKRKIDDGLGSESSETSTNHVVFPLGTNEENISLPKSNISPEKPTDPVPKKSSKLPPVCLRVDPLPRKKSSKSSSYLQQSHLSEDLKSKSKVKTVEVANQRVADSVQTGCQKAQGRSSSKGESYIMKKKMAVNEAALIIQSVYRGFQVRKSQPLMKLRQISKVRSQVVELRQRIQDLASSSNTCQSDKQKLIIGETIMSLLLKLDTIQGLHPVVRDIRKSVAKELVGLQEKLDSYTPIKETMSSTELVMHPGHVSIQEGSDRSDGNVKSMGSEAAESLNDDGAEACNVNLQTNSEAQNENTTQELTNCQLQVSVETKHPVDDAVQEKFDKDQVPADYIDEEVELDTCISENHEADETHATKSEKPVEETTKDRQFQVSEQPVDDATQEKSDQLQANPDSNVGIVHEANASSTVFDHCEVQVAESQEETKPYDIRLAPESQQIFENVESWEHYDPIFKATESVDDGNVDRERMAEMKVETPAVNGVQEDYDVVVAHEALPAGWSGEDGKLMKDVGVSSVEENEKLRMAVEELMKEQLGVISELAARVKDVEKKLCNNKKKKKKMKVNNNKCNTTRVRGLDDELVRDCLV
uniref:BAG family molecular chaperone regulator 6 n=1 Tax=Erigeron canadensis TaxID=72917 RepID=UPI001CB8A99D|nr:BAG family molecular chaperone regulator 6 [Erigeron canadensis]